MTTNKTIAKNTIFLYVRMILTMCISLFTSRIVLDALGFVDYGIYALVGGIVTLFSFMHSSLSGATTRFMNFEMGRENVKNLKTVFSTSVIIHLLLSLVIIFLGETVGLWLLYNKLNIPGSRFFAANVVFQLSLLAVVMTVLQTPYDAAIIAHQKMSIYAYISIAEAILKLVVAYCVIISPFDKLIAYALLTLVSSMIVRLFYRIYCRKNFAECTFEWCYDKVYIKSIALFFGWDLYGNMSVAAKNQGIQILQNAFFGTVVNAAAGIANTVTGVVGGLSSNFTLAIKPQIFQLFSAGKTSEMNDLVFLSARFTYFLMFLLSICFIVETDFFLSNWLINVPEFASVFCKLIFVQLCISSLFRPVNLVIHATGKIKLLSFIGGTILFFSVLVTYLILKVYPNPLVAYVINIFTALVTGVINLYILKFLISSFDISKYFFEIMGKNVLLTIVASIPGIIFHIYYPHIFLKSILVIMMLLSTNIIVIYYFGLQASERAFVLSKVKQSKIGRLYFKSNRITERKES